MSFHVLGQSERPALTLAIPFAVTALLALAALAPGCIIYDGDSGWSDWNSNCEPCSGDVAPVTDSDGDGLNDDVEVGCNLDPNNADTDGDGVLDGDEDLDGDGFTTSEEIAFGSNCADGGDHPGTEPAEGEGDVDVDADGDGLTASQEAACGTTDNYWDSDNDGVLDVHEDLDGDGYDNAWEVAAGTSCSDPNDHPGSADPPPPPPTDTDGDGVSDDDEAARGTDPNSADTDGDGQCDGAEIQCGSSPLDPFITCT